MRRPVYGPGSFHDSAQCASLASYEAFNSLRFLADASGRRIQGRKLDKYIIRDRDYLVFAGNPLGNKSKEEKDRFPRMDWDLFTKRLDSNKLWKRFYRMSKESFSDLLALIRPELERNVAQGARSTFDGVVSPELRLSMTLRWLAGGSYIDIAIIHGVAVSTFYDVVKDTVQKLDACEALNLHFPLKNEDELWSNAKGFQDKAQHVVFTSAVGALDGILIECNAPNRRKCKNPVAFWTRKSKYAWNVQAVCDANRDFLYMSLKCPGSTHDSHAWGLSELGKALNAGKLVAPFYLLADSAYKGHACVMTPFDGKQTCVWKNSFNFHLSQLRINIECAFGALCQRWGIFWRKMQGDYNLQPRIISVCMKLHNYCNRDSRDQLSSARRDSPSVDDYFDMSGERNRRGIQVAGQGVVGRAQPLSRNSSNHQGRLPPLSAVRVHTRPPPGWKIIPDSSIGPTHEYRLACVRGFKLLNKKRPVVLLASNRSRRVYE